LQLITGEIFDGFKAMDMKVALLAWKWGQWVN